MEISINGLKPIVTVGKYLWCAAVTNVFIAGVIYTASLAGAQVDAVKKLNDIKETAQQVLTAKERRDHALAKVDD